MVKKEITLGIAEIVYGFIMLIFIMAMQQLKIVGFENYLSFFSFLLGMTAFIILWDGMNRIILRKNLGQILESLVNSSRNY